MSAQPWQRGLYLVWLRIVHRFSEGGHTRRHWVLRFILAAQIVSLAASLLSDLRIVLVQFNPLEVASEFEGDFTSGARSAKSA